MKLYKIVAALTLTLLVSHAAAQSVKPLKSFALRSSFVQCDSSDQLMPLDGYGNWSWPPATPGAIAAGSDPRGPVNKILHIRAVCVTHWINGPITNSYALAGHGGRNGDYATPPIVGPGTMCFHYPSDAPKIFEPGDYLDAHASCQRGDHAVSLSVWYTD